MFWPIVVFGVLAWVIVKKIMTEPNETFEMVEILETRSLTDSSSGDESDSWPKGLARRDRSPSRRLDSLL
jgi:hypothetical protein